MECGKRNHVVVFRRIYLPGFRPNHSQTVHNIFGITLNSIMVIPVWNILQYEYHNGLPDAGVTHRDIHDALVSKSKSLHQRRPVDTILKPQC
jgi:hypothetical protein